MNKKGISMLVTVAIIVIAVVVVGVVAYYMWTTGDGGEPTPTPTPTPNVGDATSISFDVALAEETDKFTAKNLGTSNVLLRVDQTDAQGNTFIYLMNQTAQTAWANFGGDWMDVSATFEADYWSSPLIGKVALDSYIDALADWTGTGDYQGDGFTISNIALNPDLADSVFQP